MQSQNIGVKHAPAPSTGLPRSALTHKALVREQQKASKAQTGPNHEPTSGAVEF